MRDAKRLVEYVRGLVLGARGNAVSFTLKQVKRALGAETKSEEAALRAILEALAILGLLQKVPGRKTRYLLRRGTPLWSALEQGCTDLLAVLAGRHPGEGKPNAQPGGDPGQPARRGHTHPRPRGTHLPGRKTSLE